MKYRIPLVDYYVGDKNVPIPLITVRVIDRAGTSFPQLFRVDTGADLCAFPLELSRFHGVHVPQTRPAQVHSLIGVRSVFRHQIRLRIHRKEHSWPCNFISSAISSSNPFHNLPVLGRAGFLDEYAASLDNGYFIFSRLGRYRLSLRAILHWMWRSFGGIHPYNEPV